LSHLSSFAAPRLARRKAEASKKGSPQMETALF
jgi:hypothetical protein